MKSIVVASLIVLGIASSARAGAVFELDVLTPPPHPNGAYDPGQIVDFSVSASTDLPDDVHDIRLITLDFQASSPELTFVGPDDCNIGAPGQDGIPEFVFDFSTIETGAFYGRFPNFMRPNITMTGLLPPAPGFLLTIPSNGSLLLGTGQVQLPEVVGTYTLDALNPAGANGGAKLQFDFSNVVTWTAGNGEITGNSPLLVVVPEPTSAALCIAGIALMLRTRRRHGGRRRWSGSVRRGSSKGGLDS